jgi:pilus assembly protein CpaB
MIFGVLAVLAATLAAIVVYSALRKREAELQKAVANTVEIAVAAHDLPLGSRIDPEAVRTVRWARDSLPPGAVTNPQSVMNFVVKDAITENEPIVAGKLSSGERSSGILPLLIPPGMRAMSVAVDEVSDVAGFILPHSRVDVLVSLTQSGDRAFSKVVLQNVEVLAVAQEVEGKKDEPQLVRVVTLMVSPDDAERLALASNRGVLRLALRNYSDDKVVLTNGSDVDSMLRAYNAVRIPVQEAQTTSAVTHPPVSRGDEANVEIVRDGKRRQVISFLKGVRIPPPASEESPSQPAPGAAQGSPAGAPNAPPGSPQAAAPEQGATRAASGSGEMSFAKPKGVDMP